MFMDEVKEEAQDIYDKASIGLNSYNVTDQLAEAISQNLKSNYHLNALILKRTNLNDQSFKYILANIPQSLRKLDLSNNPSLSHKSYQDLGTVLKKQNIRLTHINLDGNLVGDTVCMELCETIKCLKALEVLNLSKCNITDISTEQIASLLTDSYLKIKVLVLHWNKIKGKGSENLAKAVYDNTSIQIFDASFNNMGTGPLQKIIKKKKNRALNRNN